DRVVQEVPEDLHETRAVARDGRSPAAERGFERDAARVRLRANGLYGLAHDGRELDRLALDTHLAREYRGHVEQVVDEPRERLGVLLYDAHAAADLRLAESARANHVRPAEYGRQGRAQFVRERGEEFVLRAVDLLRALVETRVLDGERGARGYLLRVGDVLGGVIAPRARRGEGERAYRTLARDERDGEEGLESQFAQDARVLFAARYRSEHLVRHYGDDQRLAGA